jgi:hypothetical protein
MYGTDGNTMTTATIIHRIMQNAKQRGKIVIHTTMTMMTMMVDGWIQ